MDGSGIDLIIIPVVVMISLAAWLIAVAYTASHPQWQHGPAAPQQARTTALPRVAAPRPRPEIPAPVRQPAVTRPLATAGTPTTEPSIAQGGGR
jgi:hypothetical protein